MSDRGVISRLYKKYLKLNNTKDKQYNLKWIQDLNKQFLKEYIQMASKHMEKILPPLVIREMQI